MNNLYTTIVSYDKCAIIFHNQIKYMCFDVIRKLDNNWKWFAIEINGKLVDEGDLSYFNEKYNRL